METSPGRVIRMLREGLDMSQAEFARALDWSPATISAGERGPAQPSRLAATTLCAALALGLPGSARHASPPPAPTAQRQPPPATHREGAASPAAEPAHALASAVAAAPVARAAAPAAPVVRLDGLVL